MLFKSIANKNFIQLNTLHKQAETMSNKMTIHLFQPFRYQQWQQPSSVG